MIGTDNSWEHTIKCAICRRAHTQSGMTLSNNHPAVVLAGHGGGSFNAVTVLNLGRKPRERQSDRALCGLRMQAKRQTRCRHSLRLETRESGKQEIALEIISARLDSGLIFCSLVFEKFPRARPRNGPAGTAFAARPGVDAGGLRSKSQQNID